MSIARVRMVDFVSEESSIAFEKEYIKKALELVPKALNLIMTRTGPESLLHISVYQNQEDVDTSLKAIEEFMVKKGSIKDTIHLHGPVSNYYKNKVKSVSLFIEIRNVIATEIFINRCKFYHNQGKFIIEKL